MKHSTLCARALLDHAIQERDNRFFVEHFGERIEEYSLLDYSKLLTNLTSRLRLNILNQAVKLEDVPPVIRDLFIHGATIENVQHFYTVPTSTLNKYRRATLPKKIKFEAKSISRSLLTNLAQMAKNVDKLDALEIIQLSSQNRISVRRLMLEVMGEL